MGRAAQASWWATAALATLTALPAQQPPAPGTTTTPPQGRSPAQAGQQGQPGPVASPRTLPTHAPLPALPPLDAWQHIRAGNAARVAAQTAGRPLPPPADRPAGAGRYVCAVFVCADADVDVPAALGLHRRDVLLISTPGPFVSREAICLLEHLVREERLSLVLILAHPRCTTLDMRPAGAGQDALSAQLDAVHADARRHKCPLARALVQAQREQLLATSTELRRRTTTDELRVVPGEIDARSGAIVWHHRHADELPLLPVK
ncbi:MAG TPA: hypothetical protein VF384_19640 [Planctomycetota bacterium]